MPPTEATSGGEVEHELAMLEGILLVLVELKLHFKNLNDHVAQVLLELLCEFLSPLKVLISETPKPLIKRIATGVFIHSHPSTPF
jgi:hypothetical protein